MYVNNVSTDRCVIDRLYEDVESAKVTCTFSYNAFDNTQNVSMETYVVLFTLGRQIFTSQTYWEGQLLTAAAQQYSFLPDVLVMKKGMRFFLDLKRKAVIDISRLEAKLGVNELRIISYQSGAFQFEVLQDDISDRGIYVSVYDKEDTSRRFFYRGFLSQVELIIPETEAYLIGFNNWPFAEDKTLHVKGKIEGHPSVVQVYGSKKNLLGTAPIIEVHPEYIIIETNDVIRGSPGGYLMLEGHEGKVSVNLLSRYLSACALRPNACEAGATCTISVSPLLPNPQPYVLSVLDSNGSVMNITYYDVSTAYEYTNVQYIPDFPSNVNSIVTFSVDNIPRITSSTELISIPSGDVLFTEVQPRFITVQVQQPLPRISVYGAGMDHLSIDLEMFFRPKAGSDTITLKMKKIRDSTGMLVYTRILTDEDCLPAYACYESLHAVYPMPLVRDHSADILFRPVEPTGEQHRVYFEIYIRHPTVDTLLQMMKDMSMFTLECTNAQFSQFKTVNSIGGTWVDVSVTNSNEQCMIILTKGFYDTRSKLYKLLSLTGRSSGAHSQVECNKLTPIIFRRDCDIPDVDYFIPVPPASNPVDNSSPKVNEHNYTIIFISLFIGIVGATAAGWYFCKYRKDKLKKNTRDVYNRM